MTLAGCAAGQGDKAGGPADTLVIARAADVKDLLPVLYQSPSDGAVVAELNVPIFRTSFDCALSFAPGLAESWEFSEDGRTLRIELSDAYTWADGKPVTAEDLRFAWDLIADPKVGSPRADSLGRLRPDARPRVVDAHTVEFGFAEPYEQTAMLALVASVLPVPKHLLDSPAVDRASLRGHPLDVQSPIGDGPWKVASWEKGKRLVLEPNERFTGPDELRPHLAKVVFEVIPVYADRVAALRAGTVDLVEGVLVADADMLAVDADNIMLRRRGWRSMEYVAWNEIDPTEARANVGGPRSTAPQPNRLFADREVRRALAMAIDTDAFIKELLTSPSTGEVYGRPAIGTIAPALCGTHNDTIQRLPYDPADARARLGELGWTDTNNDGWLDKDGQPFRFTMITNEAFPRRTQAAALLKEQLAAVGIDVQVEQIESNTFYERLHARDFDAALSSWTASLFVDPTPIWGPDSEYNFTSYRNPDVTALLQAGLQSPEGAGAADTWRALQATIYDDQPYAFLYWMDDVVGLDDRFLDTTIDVLGGARELHRWTVPTERVKRGE